MSGGLPILMIHSYTRNLQSTREQVFRNGTHKHTGLKDIATESAQRADLVKSIYIFDRPNVAEAVLQTPS